jgi:OOP family OmpA-OmpF porin
MKSIFKKTILFLAVIIMSGKLSAQSADSTLTNPDYIKPFSAGSAYRTWSIGIHGGVMTTSNAFTSNARLGFTIPNIEYGYGGYIKKQILPSFGIQADLLVGKLNGDNSQRDSAGVSPYKSFTTTIKYAGSLSGNYTVANINWRFIKSTILPYVTSGVGLMNYTPVLTSSAGVTQNFKPGSGALNELFSPVGAGLKFNVSSGINIDLGYQVNFVYANNLDGYHYGYSNEKYSYAHIGLEFAFGSRSKPQLAVHNPVASMRQEYLDGIQNAKNGMDALHTLVDSEKVKNLALQEQVSAANAVIAKLTMDSDGDGVSDYFDKCPNTPQGVKVDGSGCPLSIPRPEEKIYITEADKVVVKEAVQNLEFNTGSAIISEPSYPSLERLAKLLADKKFHLKLAGYTDSTGSADLNLQLSKDRAEAIKMFLVSRGADPGLIQTEGYGKANPIASNKTKAGRKLNRRVEFSLY